MPKNDVENDELVRPARVRPGYSGLDFESGGEVRRGFAPPVTGGSGFEPLRSKNALHPAGCGGKNLCKNEVGKNDAKIR